MTHPTHITIATRESELAIWQAEYIKSELVSLYPRLEVTILGMTTQGDKTLNKSLSKIGGKGLFIKELEVALQNKEADIAVHSLKDLPMHLSEEFMIAAIGKREDARDAFISNDFGALEMLPPGSIVGTSSLRRQSQLQRRFPNVHFLTPGWRGTTRRHVEMAILLTWTLSVGRWAFNVLQGSSSVHASSCASISSSASTIVGIAYPNSS